MGASLLGLTLAACGAAEKPPLTPVTLQLQWYHQATAAGFYAAVDLGYYAAEGLEVRIVEGGLTADTITPLLDKSAHFSTNVADVLLVARARGAPVRAVATIFRRNPTVFAALAESGITRPQDFVGKTVRVAPDTAASLHAMMEHLGIPRDRYTEVALPSDVALFASGTVPVWSMYANGLAIAARRAGHKLILIHPDDYGVHFYGDTVLTSVGLIAENPELVTRFLRASLRGWMWAVQNPRLVGALVVKRKPDADAALENDKMLASLPLVNTGQDHIGWMRRDVWASMAKALRDEGSLPGQFDANQGFTTQFLERIYAAEH